MPIHSSMLDLVGKTPLVEVQNIEKKYDLPGHIAVKVEGFNPAGSVKDRVAANMIKTAEADGRLKPGTTIIEATSGNTGIGLAAIGALKGYPVVIVMPDTMSVERRNLLKAYGAKLVLTPGAQGMKGAIAKSEEIAKEVGDACIAGQFVNQANPAAHLATTGPEIWEDTDGKVDIFVSGVGTGGTISGVGEYLKAKNPDVKVVAVEPETSAVLSGEQPGKHGIQGIGAGFIPDTLDTHVYDEIIKITDQEAYEAGRELAQSEGILAGISSGAALAAAKQLAAKPENKGKLIVALLPDTGDRYLSTPMFAQE
ncbi:cysteine synthase A [Allobaculum sp. JKK-2023]|uniref:cysteine synthase A n=1 Tax=Allobaculum sp. JKK-2023 TaxID=3108943 RepID=UPI002B059A84|nr:cysteine synthase A [Allobaculum sp. JKK-2023]